MSIRKLLLAGAMAVAVVATVGTAVGTAVADVAPPPSRESTTTSSATSPRAPGTVVRAEPSSGDAVSQAQLAEVNSELDRTRSTATIALVLAVLALLLAVIGVVLARTGRRRAP
ncbi:MAG: hypothetical protein R2726_08490 [Acidimicrobiales bacterium]